MERRCRHDEEPRERDDHRDPGEEHRPAGRVAGGDDRVHLRDAARPLLAEALDDEERVVDADGEADHRDHVLGDAVDAGAVAEMPAVSPTATRMPSSASTTGTPAASRGAEHEHEHDERRRDADQFGVLQVLRGDAR